MELNFELSWKTANGFLICDKCGVVTKTIEHHSLGGLCRKCKSEASACYGDADIRDVLEFHIALLDICLDRNDPKADYHDAIESRLPTLLEQYAWNPDDKKLVPITHIYTVSIGAYSVYNLSVEAKDGEEAEEKVKAEYEKHGFNGIIQDAKHCGFTEKDILIQCEGEE